MPFQSIGYLRFTELWIVINSKIGVVIPSQSIGYLKFIE